MKIIKKIELFFISILLLLPITTLAYSNYIIPGGENIGIEVNSKGVLVVGFYKVNDKYIARDAGFKIGDIITYINNVKIENIDSMITSINNNKSPLKIKILRNNKELIKKYNIHIENNILKTGMYVKDKINGIGTLTYIDPNSKIFGSLGHEIIDSNTISKFEIKDGKIYKSDVLSITKSRNGLAGEKNANFNKEVTYGNIYKNEYSGIFGKYLKDIENMEKLEIKNPKDIKRGPAIIRTVINGNIKKDYKINILNINYDSKTKNILFEVIDKELIEKTGGIIQGMSGSPIIQDNKIIGAVNYVIVNETTKGYGIFITTMLKEGEK